MWRVETLNAIVDAEIEALPFDLRARLQRLVSVIRENGLEHLPRDASKHLEGKLWELRIIAASGIARTIYVTASERRVVLLHAFIKKTQKTPQRDLELARARQKGVMP